MNLDDLITLPQTVKLMGVSRQTVYNWLRDGTAPKHERKGDRYYFDRNDALRVKKERQQATRRK